MDQVGVQLVAQDAQFIASTKSAAAAMASVAAQETKLGAAAKELGVDGKKFSQAFAKVESQRAAESAKAAKASESAASRAAKDEERKEKRSAADLAKKKKAKQTYDADYKKASASQLADGVAMVGATAALVVGFAAVAVGIAAVTIKLAESALGAAQLKENARGFFNVLTAGRGDKTLELVDKLAGSLGEKFNDARQQFIQFRQAGLDNKQSASLIKLTADLNTVDHSGELASQAVARVLSYTSNATQTRDQANASARAMALLAKQAGVAGDGTQAAAESASTLVGALNRLDNKKTAFLENLGDRIKPSIDKAATAYAGLLDKFTASKTGQAAFNGIATGITKLADAAASAAPYIEKFAGQIYDAASNPAVKSGLEGAKIVLEGVGIAAALVAAPFVAMSAAFFATGAAALYLIGKVAQLIGNGKELASDAVGWGEDIVSGLISGIGQSAEKLYKSVTGLAQGVSKSFKSALGINSPSRVFEGHALNIGAGTQRGLDRSMPTGQDIAEGLKPPGGAVQIRGGSAQTSAASGSPGGGQSGANVTIERVELAVPRGEDPGPWMRAAGHELGLGIQAILLGQGAPA